MNVAEIPAGGCFACPDCGNEQTLDATDPGLISKGGQGNGVYDLLLEERLKAGDGLPAAELVSGPAVGTALDDKTIVNPSIGRKASPTQTEVGRTERVSPPTPRVGVARGDEIGPFRIERILGQGGMGTVFEAFDQSLHRTVALKVLSEEHSRDPETVDRFQREARSAGSLTHPNITHIYSIGEARGFHYFAMELVRGKTLAELLSEGGRLSEEDAVDYMLQIARGLRAALGKEIIHRDIKPSNLILSNDGLIKITDFGLAKVVTSAVEITATGVIIGTPLYMSPEQGRGEPLDHRTDLYSLGCAFYHLVCGRAPYTGENAMAIIVKHITDETPVLPDTDNASRRLARLIAKLMAKSPQDRFQDYDELIEGLSQVTSSASSTRIDANHGRTVLVSEQGEENLPADSLSLKLLSVADVSMELGRHDKALSLYEKVLEDNPQLEIDLSFRMLKIYKDQGDQESVERLYRRILESSTETNERFYCHWKLLMSHYHRCQAEIEQATEQLRQLLADEAPESIPVNRLKQRLEDLKELEKKLRRDSDEGIILIRRTGDLQIELD